MKPSKPSERIELKLRELVSENHAGMGTKNEILAIVRELEEALETIVGMGLEDNAKNNEFTYRIGMTSIAQRALQGGKGK